MFCYLYTVVPFFLLSCRQDIPATVFHAVMCVYPFGCGASFPFLLSGAAARSVSAMRLCAKPRPDVAVRWIARPRLIRRPAGQRRARPKFILSEAVGKFMNFSVRRASMSGRRRIQRRHSFLPFFCC